MTDGKLGRGSCTLVSVVSIAHIKRFIQRIYSTWDRICSGASADWASSNTIPGSIDLSLPQSSEKVRIVAFLDRFFRHACGRASEQFRVPLEDSWMPDNPFL